jgi:hypothetical protein
MSRKVESLKRLFKAGRITEARLRKLLVASEITQEEFEYITGE